MNSDKFRTAMSRLSQDEQDLLNKFGQITGEDPVAVALDMDIRHGLTDALGIMGSSVQMLLGMLMRNEVELPKAEMPSYDVILRGLTAAAANGAAWVNRSHEFDKSALLALTPDPCAWLQ